MSTTTRVFRPPSMTYEVFYSGPLQEPVRMVVLGGGGSASASEDRHSYRVYLNRILGTPCLWNRV